jgi:hypothetical protein
VIERIESGSSLIAIIIRSGYRKEGIEFFTPNDFSQQLAYMNRPKGYRIEPHLHNKIKRESSARSFIHRRCCLLKRAR